MQTCSDAPICLPLGVRKKYALYDGKLCTGEEAAQCIGCLSRRVASVGCQLFTPHAEILADKVIHFKGDSDGKSNLLTAR